VEVERGDTFVVRGAALLRTARKILRGEVFVPGAVWSRA
jgi:2-methylaconitate cis-trans-isomerase PrpF